MSTIFYFMMSVIMITRLIFQAGDKLITLQKTITKTIIEIIALLILAPYTTFLFFIVLSIILLNALTYFLDKSEKGNIFIKRFLVLVLYCFALSTFFPERVGLPSLNSIAATLKGVIEEYNFPGIIFKKMTWKYSFILLSGMLLVANEVNHIIRFVLSHFKVEPKKDEEKKELKEGETQEKDQVELKRGRIIGIIERVLIYYFVIEGNLTSIGFIMAAKSFTRFKELDNKNFAEYVLIGTLFSAFLAIVTGILFKKVL